ncbi:riboflavin kinase [Microbacterium oxydans]|uniref:riboflavin kinase n=1 Tax=Microbacterium TaxID=33882 RepID=UPI000F8F8DBC|nr:riboflavin kinase [Microbacterium oxydans]AZS48289.1 Riboflavin biosynthesis protein RibF [Microbacterium oxydans]
MSTAPLGTIAGVVVPGDGRGRGLGFPTANLALDGAEAPADGIYAAWTRIDDDPQPWAASVSVGTNPTFAGDRERRVEVHLHDADLDLYGRRLFVTLVARLRPTLQFDGVDALIAQTADDVARCRSLLSDHARIRH